MRQNADDRRSTPLKLWRLLGWGIIAGLIALPAIAMQFTAEVRWETGDFAFALTLLGGVGLALELAIRAGGDWAYRGGAAVALAAGLLMLWANAAVGIVGNEENDINIVFNLIPLLALFGAIGAQLSARGLAAAMAAVAAAQAAIGLLAQTLGHSIWVFTAIWSGAWLLSAWLFRQAARRA